MNQSLAQVALVVRDHAEAVAFYTRVLGSDPVGDTDQPERGTRRVVVKPKGEGSASILPAKA